MISRSITCNCNEQKKYVKSISREREREGEIHSKRRNLISQELNKEVFFHLSPHFISFFCSFLFKFISRVLSAVSLLSPLRIICSLSLSLSLFSYWIHFLSLDCMMKFFFFSFRMCIDTFRWIFTGIAIYFSNCKPSLIKKILDFTAKERYCRRNQSSSLKGFFFVS